ncbi:MAG: type III pantothenate kinase [Planctomycetota bacterium]|jgi:type III pantothenate kinase
MQILAADIGNTKTAIAIMDGLNVLKSFDISSHASVPDTLHGLLHGLDEEHKSWSLIAASVNPRGLETLEEAFKQFGGGNVQATSRELNIPIDNNTTSPDKVGQDRLLNSLAARKRFGEECIVVDFGTAITFDVVQGGAYVGGVITPGIGLAMEALHQKTALLPLVEPKGNPPILGKDTASAIHAGVYHGYIGLVRNVLAELVKLYASAPPIIATGGYGVYLAEEIPEISEAIPSLTHEGIALAWQAQT